MVVEAAPAVSKRRPAASAQEAGVPSSDEEARAARGVRLGDEHVARFAEAREPRRRPRVDLNPG
ncbi:hypothetical protein EAO77_34910 [Streptomyces sp. t39]|nr:hypothetical protein EAO77_34910 [Streptomyces sp. t39]